MSGDTLMLASKLINRLFSTQFINTSRSFARNYFQISLTTLESIKQSAMEEGKAQNSGQNAEENKTATENPKENDVSGEITTGDEEGENAEENKTATATENPKEDDVSGEKTTGNEEGENAEENKTATENPKENDVSGEKTTSDEEGENAEENKAPNASSAIGMKGKRMSLNEKGHGENPDDDDNAFWGFLEYDEKKELQFFLDEKKALQLTNDDLEKNFIAEDVDSHKRYNFCIVKLINDPDTYCIGGDWSRFVKERKLQELRDVGFSKNAGIVGIEVLAETTSSEDD